MWCVHNNRAKVTTDMVDPIDPRHAPSPSKSRKKDSTSFFCASSFRTPVDRMKSISHKMLPPPLHGMPMDGLVWVDAPAGVGPRQRRLMSST